MQTDTHSYDGKIPILIQELSEISKLSLEEKKNLIEPLSTLELPGNSFLSAIIADLGTGRNFDASNRLNADDLLVLCARFVSNKDFLEELNVQLLDMKTGFCPQGRTHRLYQLLFAFLDVEK